MRWHYPLFAFLLAGHSLVSAQAQSGSRPADPGELYYQLQLLQEQVMELRGQLEEQGSQLRKLQQQRLDDYIDLDRRLSELSTGAAASSRTPATAPQATPAPTAKPAASVAPAAAPALSEADAYQQAFSQVKARQFDEATQSFLKFLKDFPSSELTPNAWYWLGELYLQGNNLADAKTYFQKVVDKAPQHTKVPDALFKLGKVNRMQGNTDAAKKLLQRVISQYPDSNAAQLAQTELNTQF